MNVLSDIFLRKQWRKPQIFHAPKDLVQVLVCYAWLIHVGKIKMSKVIILSEPQK